jgi:anaerobic sulfite reductase subunit B
MGERLRDGMDSNVYLPFPSVLKEIIRHTEKEWTFRMGYGDAGKVKPGQFFEVSVPKYGEAPISVSGIGEDYVDLTIRRVGRVTDEVFKLKEGSTVLLRGPYGNGFDTSLYEDGEVMVIAGGTGVSPVRGVIEALAGTADAKDKHVIVGFRSPGDLLFRDDLKAWAEALDLILTVDGAPEGSGYKGNIGLVTKYIPDVPIRDIAKAQAIVVGPPAMMRFSVKGLLEKGFREENIWVSQERKMCCGLGKCGHCRIGSTYVCLDGPVFNYVDSKDMID